MIKFIRIYYLVWDLKKRRRGWWWKGIDFQADETRTILSHGAFEIISKLEWSSLESKSTIVFVTIVINRYGSMPRTHGRWSSAQSWLSASSFSPRVSRMSSFVLFKWDGQATSTSNPWDRWRKRKWFYRGIIVAILYPRFTQGWNLIRA